MVRVDRTTNVRVRQSSVARPFRRCRVDPIKRNALVPGVAVNFWHRGAKLNI
jgi:hypothetical protein